MNYGGCNVAPLLSFRNPETFLPLSVSLLPVPIWADLEGDKKEQPLYTPHDRASYLSQDQVSFVRPGLKFTIQSVLIGEADLKIRVTFSITDDLGLPLDRLGIYTPGPVSTSFVAASIPKDQSQYVAYTTRDQTSPITGVKAPRRPVPIPAGLTLRSAMGCIPTLLAGPYRRTSIER